MATSTPTGLTSAGTVSRRRFTRKRALLGVLLLLVVVGGTYGVRLALSLASITHQSPIDAIKDIIQGKGGSVVQGEIDGLKRINIAVYGYGGPPHDGAYLTDSILIASLQPRRGAPPQIAEVSVPRDWFVPIQYDGKTLEKARINQAYADGAAGAAHLPADTASGAKVAAATLEKVLGIHIDHFVGLDFTAFQSGVDAVGGVDVDVATAFTDYQYPRGECGTDGSGDCSYKTVHFDAGPHHMDGATALIFSRSRHSPDPGEGTDFARSRRQQMVLQSLKQKVVSVGGLSHLPDLLNALSDHLATDLKIGDAEALYDLVKGVDHSQIARVSVDDSNFLYECGFPANCPASYLYAHDATFASLGGFMNHLLPDPGALDEHAAVTITDGSGTGSGASTRWTSLFHSLGFDTADGGPARSQPTTQVIDQTGGKDARTARWLADYYGVTAELAPPSPAGGSGGGVQVILGRDEELTFNRSTPDSTAPVTGLDLGSPSASPSASVSPRLRTSSIQASPSPSRSARPSASASASASAEATPTSTPASTPSQTATPSSTASPSAGSSPHGQPQISPPG